MNFRSRLASFLFRFRFFLMSKPSFLRDSSNAKSPGYEAKILAKNNFHQKIQILLEFSPVIVDPVLQVATMIIFVTF